MQIQHFIIRLNSEQIQSDQNKLNDFLNTVTFKKSSTQFVETTTSYWSVLIHYEQKSQQKVNETEPQKEYDDLSENDRIIYKNLRNWRTQKAEELNVKVFMICHNSELINIAIQKPDSINDLKKIIPIMYINQSEKNLIIFCQINEKKY